MKKKLLAIVIYLFLFSILLFILSKIFIPKWLEGNDNYIGSSMRGFYDEKKNSLDVLFVGNSNIYSGIVPIELWDEYGIASYVYASPDLRAWTGYYMLNEALIYQHPKIIVYDIQHFTTTDDSPEPNYRKAFDNMKWNKPKFDAIILDNIFNLKEKIDYIFPIFRYHDRWGQLTGADFKYAFSNEHSSYKGYDLKANVQPYTGKKSYMNEETDEFEINSRVKKYLDKFVDKCKEENIELVLVAIPTTNWWRLSASKTMDKYAKSKNIPFIDLNLRLDEIGFDWEKDTLDGGEHANIYGAEKITKYIGHYLEENYNLPDRTNDEDYSIWHEDSRIFHRDAENLKNITQNYLYYFDN